MTDATGTTSPSGFALGEYEPAYRDAVDRARDEAWAERLFARDVLAGKVHGPFPTLEPGHLPAPRGGHPTLSGGDPGVERSSGTDPGHS